MKAEELETEPRLRVVTNPTMTDAKLSFCRGLKVCLRIGLSSKRKTSSDLSTLCSLPLQFIQLIIIQAAPAHRSERLSLLCYSVMRNMKVLLNSGSNIHLFSVSSTSIKSDY